MHGQAIEPHGESFLALFLRPAGIVRTLPAVPVRGAENQLLLFSDGRHGLGVKLLAIDGRGVGTTPVEINPAVLVLEGVRIPERERFADFLKVVVQGILAAIDGAGVPVGGRENEPVAYLTHVRSIAEGRQLPVFMPVPMEHVVGVVKAAGHRGEEIVAPLEKDQRGVGRLTGGLLIVVLELIGNVQGIDQYAHHAFPSFRYLVGDMPYSFRKQSVK